MEIRKSAEKDLEKILEIYSCARAFMVRTGNPNQWGDSWPPEDIVRRDIEIGRSFVCINDKGEVAGTFYYDFGPDIEPTYRTIDGAWLEDSPYGVVHRIASNGSQKGIGAFCINWAFEQCGHIRIDTHSDNVVMQNLLGKLGFTRCGIIHIIRNNAPRLAFEKVR